MADEPQVVEPGDQPQAPPSETPPTAPPSGEESSWISKWWWLIALVAVALIIVIVLLARGCGGADTVAVPDVVGMTVEEAETALTDAGLVLGDTSEEESADAEPGTVLSQDPEADSEVDTGAAVNLVIVPEAPEMAVVPDVVGMTVEDAEAALTDAGLVLGDTTEVESADADPGTVLSQDPEADTEVDPESAVDVVVAVAPAVPVVPDVVGISESDATAAIEEASLVARVYVVSSEDVPEDIVIEQEPAAGEELEAGGTVSIVVSSGPATPPGNETVVVPDLSGMTTEEAIADLEGLGLVPEVVDVYDGTVPEGGVIAQFPAADTEVLAGSAVAVLSSKGSNPEPGTVEAPDVVGMTAADAEAAIMDLGLDVIPLTMPYDQADIDTVFYQLPPAGSDMQVGSYMVIFVAGEPSDGSPPSIQPHVGG